MTTTPAPNGLDTLTALEQAATPAPWKADTHTRGDCVLWGPDGQFVANAQAEPHWLPAADGGKRAVMFDVDRRDVALIEAMRNALPALLDELATLRADVEWHHETLPKVTDQRNAASVQAEQWEKRYAEMLVQRDTAIEQHAAAREELAKTCAELDAGRAAMTKVRDYIARHWADEPAADCEVGVCNCLRFVRDTLAAEANPATTAEPADEPKVELCSDKNGFHDGHDWTPDPCEPYRWCPGYPVPRQPNRTCGHKYVGNEGEFTCDLYDPHPGKHWNSLAEIAWTAEPAAG